jgi:hypothetical protein
MARTDGVGGFTKWVRKAEIEMVANAPGSGESGLASQLLSLGLVQTSLGQRTKDSSNEGFGVLKPLAQISVYTDADRKKR